MRKACLIFAFTVSLATAAMGQLPVQPTVKPSAQPDTLGSRREDPADSIGQIPAVPPIGAQVADTARAADTAAAAAETLETPAPAPDSRTAVPTLPPPPASRALINDWPLAARQYGFGIAGQAVAGALGFFIGSAIETAFEGEEDAHKGTLSFTEIRYDNFYGAFWGASMAGLFGSSLTVYFTGQSDEEDGGFFWTMVGTGLAGAGALYAAHLMGVNDEPDWKPFMPLLAIPSAGGVIGFSVSRWFSDRKRERIMGPDAGLRVLPPRFAWTPTASGDRFDFQALNLSF